MDILSWQGQGTHVGRRQGGRVGIGAKRGAHPRWFTRSVPPEPPTQPRACAPRNAGSTPSQGRRPRKSIAMDQSHTRTAVVRGWGHTADGTGVRAWGGGGRWGRWGRGAGRRHHRTPVSTHAYETGHSRRLTCSRRGQCAFRLQSWWGGGGSPSRPHVTHRLAEAFGEVHLALPRHCRDANRLPEVPRLPVIARRDRCSTHACTHMHK
jgi:hypothetical protein